MAVRGQLAAYNARDVEAFVRTFTPAATVLYFPEGNPLARGHAEIHEVYRDLFDATPELHCEILSTMVLRDWVVVHERITGLPEQPVYHFIGLYRVTAEGLVDWLWLLPEGGNE